jgi:hypothetical protein
VNEHPLTLRSRSRKSVRPLQLQATCATYGHHQWSRYQVATLSNSAPVPAITTGKTAAACVPSCQPGLDRGIPSAVCVEAARFNRATVLPIMTNCSIGTMIGTLNQPLQLFENASAFFALTRNFCPELSRDQSLNENQ